MKQMKDLILALLAIAKAISGDNSNNSENNQQNNTIFGCRKPDAWFILKDDQHFDFIEGELIQEELRAPIMKIMPLYKDNTIDTSNLIYDIPEFSTSDPDIVIGDYIVFTTSNRTYEFAEAPLAPLGIETDCTYYYLMETNID